MALSKDEDEIEIEFKYASFLSVIKIEFIVGIVENFDANVISTSSTVSRVRTLSQKSNDRFTIDRLYVNLLPNICLALLSNISISFSVFIFHDKHSEITKTKNKPKTMIQFNINFGYFFIFFFCHIIVLEIIQKKPMLFLTFVVSLLDCEREVLKKV